MIITTTFLSVSDTIDEGKELSEFKKIRRSFWEYRSGG
jgi:hypothetical protein